MLQNSKEKLWTPGFFILWQSQLVSTFKILMSDYFLLVVTIVIPFYFIKSFKKFISYDYENDSLKDLIES